MCKTLCHLIRKINRVAIVFILMITLQFQTSSAQIIRAGFTAGAQLSWVRLDDSSFRDSVSISPVPGFRVGGVLSFKVKDRYFLHTEYVYSQKGKIARGKIDDQLKDEVTYRYLEVPILFTMHFKGTIGKDRQFKWYVGAGPNISYMLGGKGTIASGELKEDGVDKLDYKIYFENRPDNTLYSGNVYYPVVNRFQFGLDVGAGLLLEPFEGHKVMIDLRYGFDQTRISRDANADYQRPADYDDNLRQRNRSIRASVIYLLEYNLDKKERNKGKSNKKR